MARSSLTIGGLHAALLCFASAAACAQSLPSAVEWSVSAGATHRRLTERTDAGARLLEESGPLARLQLGAQRTASGGAAFGAELGFAGGRLDYEGQTQAGTPLTTTSRHQDLDFTLLLRPSAPAAWGEAWLSLRVARQRREIASTALAGGLNETSSFLMPGVRWRGPAWTAAGWHWIPSAELRASVRHRLHVDYLGVFDDSRLDGGRRRELVLGLSAAPAGSPWRWTAEWTGSRQSASDREALYRAGTRVGSVRQPRLEVSDISLRVSRVF